ncbi:ORF6N domain-containing protein [Chromatium okenii]|jgi:hypothetical protein|uniref:KilA-N DNA-binding domain-containing protein n=1 Tax=Chromatium okenii TaxID=61644 RepID=A0A2S7XMN3_9GAMM|nr:ORF6N domain-containing protein [Chromatium okenii]MBV5309113.1 ORF6N domain-containing protein [Chromatium okenii]PQJ94916.1 hypothetical protein CXB77_17460 [Chromatium okenii]
MEICNITPAVCINSIEVTPIIVRGQRVLTLAQIDKIHERPAGTARKRFNDNKNRMTEGEDYFVLEQASEIRTHGLGRSDGSTPEKITVVTESGYLLLVKSFTDDLAWQIQRTLVKAYFRVEAAAAKPTITDPILAALVHGLIEIDGIKQQQVLITRKTEQLESRVEHVELQHRNGVPQGYLSRSQAHVLYGMGLSAEVFHLALHRLEVPTTPYIHHGEDGNDVATFGYIESDIADAVQIFIKDAVQVTRCMCESPLLNSKRFRYSK